MRDGRKARPQPAAAAKRNERGKAKPPQRDGRERARPDSPEYGIADVAFMQRGNEQGRDGRR
jgi:hypothetical protein